MVRIAVVATSCLLFAATPSLAGWSENPVEVHATVNACPLVAACADGAHGAIIAWQEGAAGAAGVLRARRLLATGEVDPAWPSPAMVCSTAAARSMLGAVSDGLGGAYVWWKEGAALYLSRLGPEGVVAAGWPERGRLLENLNWAPPRAIGDGQHGLYVAWVGIRYEAVWNGSTYDIVQVWRQVVLHVGPGNSSAGGWGPFPKVIGTANTAQEFVTQTSIGIAPDGGLWLVWSTIVPGTDVEMSLLGSWWVARILPSGSPRAGFDPQGVALGPFPGEDPTEQFLYVPADGGALWPTRTLGGVVSDGAGGAYVLTTRPAYPPSGYWLQPILTHVDEFGAPLPGWPRDAGGGPLHYQSGGPASESFSLLQVEPGVLLVGAPYYGVEGQIGYRFVRHTEAAAGGIIAETRDNSLMGLEYVVPEPGHIVLANCLASGTPGSWITGPQSAFVNVSGSLGGEGFREQAPDWTEHRYGDVALSPTGDGGAIFAWSQYIGRQGIFAVRLNRAGLVTDVPPAGVASAPSLALRFASGAGLRASAVFAGAGEARLLVADVSGRAVARETFEAGEGAREWTIPGTASLAPGLYFARVQRGAVVLTARVVVTR